MESRLPRALALTLLLAACEAGSGAKPALPDGGAPPAIDAGIAADAGDGRCGSTVCGPDEVCLRRACYPKDCPEQPCAPDQVCDDGLCREALCAGILCDGVMVCVAGACEDGCVIDGLFQPAGGPKPGDSCQVCQPAISTSAWSALEDGTLCEGGLLCAGGVCGGGAGCTIGGTAVPNGAKNPANPCESCQPGVSASTWTALADGQVCGSGEICKAGACAGGCWIDGAFQASDTVNPANPCQRCQPANATSAWTSLGDGTTCGPGKVCQSGACGSGCVIGGISYPSGELDLANPCASCQPAVSTMQWTNLADGASCGTGLFCRGGSCLAGCWIDSAHHANGSANPANACQKCDSSFDPVAWTELEDGTPCGNGQTCQSGACGSGCVIAGVSHASGATNPANACESCQPGVSTSAWTGFADGTSCGGGKLCSAGSCLSGCWIGSAFHAPGAPNPANGCYSCQPAISASAWSKLADGSMCGNGQVCQSGGCVAGCVISGVQYNAGDLDPANPCASCQPAVSTTAWTNLSGGAKCGTAKVCNGAGSCAAGCWIDGAYRASGTANPANPCQTCAPASSTTTWTAIGNGSACGTGKVCNAGACTAGCWIGNTYYADASTNPANACQKCQASVATASWTSVSDGNACGNGQICQSGACGSGCSIGGVSYASGAANPENPCTSCQPGVSTTDWTDLTAGTSCGAGKVCTSAAACLAGCWIGGAFQASGATNPANACQSCAPATSTASWSAAANGAGCGAGKVCNDGSCAEGCWIDSAFVAEGSANPTNPCGVCAASLSASEWSNRDDGTACGTGQICVGGSCGSGCFIGGAPYSSGAANPANACASCQPAASTTLWTNLPNGTGCGAGSVCSAGACSPGCWIGSTYFASGAAKPANPCQACVPATSTTAWTATGTGTGCGAGKVCNAGTCSTGCWIGASYYADAAANPGNVCQKCQAATSTTAWTNLSDGTSCGNGQICQSGACGSGCLIGGTNYASGALNPANPCASCQPGVSTTTWTNLAGGTGCGTGKVCSAGTCSTGCWIGSTYYANGAANPANPCQTCAPAMSTTAWTSLANGTSCGTGSICSGGTCAAGCLINAAFYSDGSPNPANGCQKCQATTSTSAWTNLGDGTGCGTGQICLSGSCSSGCLIGGSSFANGAANPVNPCASCQPTVSTSAWTNLAGGTSCGAGQVCSAGVCSAGCWIDAAFKASGAANPLNACQTCAPATSTTAWTPVANGTGCGTAKVCNAAACSTGCWIGSTYYADGAANPGNACQKCQAALSTTAWTNLSDGTTCGNGQICQSGACGSGCLIGGTNYASGALNPANPCASCQPGVSTTAWTNLAGGTGCGTGKVCNAGTCATGCWIGSTYYADGAANPANPCQRCQVATSTTAWTSIANGTSCGTGSVCSAGTCAAGCWIDSAFQADGAANPMNVCQKCQASTSTTAWTNLGEGTACGSGLVCQSGTCANGCYIGGTSYANGAANPANACASCQPGTSTTAWTNLANGTSCAAGKVCNTGTCSAGCWIGATFYASGALNPANACQSCDPASSTTSWKALSNQACGAGMTCNAGTCSAGCWISSVYYPDGTSNPANACQKCEAATSTSAWTSVANGTSCGNGQICQSGACGSGCFIGGSTYASGALNPANGCQSCQPGLSTTAWSTVADGTGCGSGTVCLSATCQSGCWISSTFRSSGAVNPANACQACTPATSTTAWTNRAQGTSCGTNMECNASGACVCVPNCTGKACGSDGCGGTCGTGPNSGCPVGQSCNASQQCIAITCPKNGPITGYGEHDGLRSITASNFKLQDTGTWSSYDALIDALPLTETPIATAVTTAGFLNRSGTKMGSKGWVGYVTGFYWSTGDLDVTYWIPQGLTGGSAGGRDIKIVSWHYDETDGGDPNPPTDFGQDKGARISIADTTNLSSGSIPYRHVLLVEPDATYGFKPIPIHAGGLAWYNNHFFVADSYKGIRVFDLNRLVTVSTDPSCSSRCGKVGALYCGYGYNYVLPQVGGYYFPSTLDATCKPVFSGLSIDRSTTPDSLISNEYIANADYPTTCFYSRVFRWALDSGTSRMVTSGGITTASGAWYSGNCNLQGATASGSKFYLSSTRYSGALMTGAAGTTSKVHRADAAKWAWMPEGVYITTAGNLWTATEGHSNLDRCVFYSDLASIP